MNPLLELQSKRGPVTKGPMERAKQLKDADAPLIAERSLAEGTVLVILSRVTPIIAKVGDIHGSCEKRELLTRLPNKHNLGPLEAP